MIDFAWSLPINHFIGVCIVVATVLILGIVFVREGAKESEYDAKQDVLSDLLELDPTLIELMKPRGYYRGGKGPMRYVDERVFTATEIHQLAKQQRELRRDVKRRDELENALQRLRLARAEQDVNQTEEAA